jgi:DUF4097 and DUF4098 domain-containing protein YvlB
VNDSAPDTVQAFVAFTRSSGGFMPARRNSLPLRVFGFTLLAAALFLPAIPAAADFRLERQLPLESGGTFVLDAATGSVVITGDSTSGANVTITSRRDDVNDRFDIAFASSPGTATVTIRRKGNWLNEWFGDWARGGLRVEVHVPRGAMADVKTAGGSIEAADLGGGRVRTSGGSLDVSRIARDLDGHTSGGSIHVREVRGKASVETSGGSIDAADIAGSLRAHSSGGGIHIDNVAGDVDASTSGGGVDVRGAGGRVDAHSSGGSITVAFASGNNRGGDVSTSGGGVRAEVDPKVALSIDASTSGGSVTADVPVTVRGTLGRRSLHGDLNGGGEMLRLHTSGGSIRIAPITGATARR